MRLKDKVAIITGAASGIGNAIAQRFAAEGGKVVINYRLGGNHNGTEVEAEIRKTGGVAAAIPAEVQERTQVEQLVAQTVGKFGRLDIPVSTAAIGIKKPFLEVTDEEWN